MGLPCVSCHRSAPAHPAICGGVWWKGRVLADLSEQLPQRVLAVVEDARQVAADEAVAEPPRARDVLDMIDDPRAAGVAFEAMLVMPPAIRADDLAIDEAHAGLPDVDDRLPG